MDRRRKNRTVKRSAKAANQIAATGRRAAGGRVRIANRVSPIKPFYSRPRRIAVVVLGCTYGRQAEGRQVSTVNSSLQILRRILRLAAEWGVLKFRLMED